MRYWYASHENHPRGGNGLDPLAIELGEGPRREFVVPNIGVHPARPPRADASHRRPFTNLPAIVSPCESRVCSTLYNFTAFARTLAEAFLSYPAHDSAELCPMNYYVRLRFANTHLPRRTSRPCCENMRGSPPIAERFSRQL